MQAPQVKKPFIEHTLDSLFIKDFFFTSNPIVREMILWLRTAGICVGLFIFGILLLVVGAGKAVLQLCMLRPIEALKTLGGNIIAGFGCIILSIVGLYPRVLNRIVAKLVFRGKDEFLNSNKRYDVINNNFFAINGFAEIQTAKGWTIDTLSLSNKSGLAEDYTIVFGANNSRLVQGNPEKYTHAHMGSYAALVWQHLGAQRNIIAFNYPGTSNNSHMESTNDAVNAGIAIVYALACKDKKNWSNEKISKHINFTGGSLGGGVAYQVALYFKNVHNINIHTHAQNSFGSLSDVAASLMSRAFKVPTWCGKLFGKMLLADFEMDTCAAISQLNPKFVHYTNVKNVDLLKRPKIKRGSLSRKSLLRKVIKDGLGPSKQDADEVLGDQAPLRKVVTGQVKYGSYNKKMRRLFKEVATQEKHIVPCMPGDKKNYHDDFLGMLIKNSKSYVGSSAYQEIMIGDCKSERRPR